MTPNPTQTKVQNKHTNKQTSNQQQPVPGIQINYLI
jgi:hypothetical protein